MSQFLHSSGLPLALHHQAEQYSSVSDSSPSIANPEISRRSFIKLGGFAGGGLVLGLSLSVNKTASAQFGPPAKPAPFAFVQIRADGKVIIFAKNPECGQGIKTGLPLIIAEELDVDWDTVEVVQSPINPALYGPQMAGGSMSIPMNWMSHRQAGALARSMLLDAAATKLGVEKSSLTTEPNTIVHAATDRRINYSEVVELASTLPIPAVEDVALKDPATFRLLGKRYTGVDNEKITRGEPLFGIDQVQEKMSIAVYEHGPSYGSTVESVNLEHIKSLKGVKDAFILESLGNALNFDLSSASYFGGVVIIADSTWAAIKAKRELEIEWDTSKSSKASWSKMQAKANELAGKDGPIPHTNNGNVDEAFSKAAATAEGFYSYHYAGHAPLEPQNCTAHYHDGLLDVWAPSQTPGAAVMTAAQAAGLDPSKVTIHQTRIGGGFGRRLLNDYVAEVAAIARRVNGPVKLMWTREDDMTHDYLRPGGFHSLKAAINSEGKLSAWNNHFMTPSIDGEKPASSADMPFNLLPTDVVDDARITQTFFDAVIPTGPMRAPGSNVLAFATQSFIHECATAANRDHLEFLLELLETKRSENLIPPPPGPFTQPPMDQSRAATIVRLVAERSGYGKKELPEGHGQGLALYFCHNGYFAHVAEVSVDESKKITVHKVHSVGDVGPIINLSASESQVEGSILDGLSQMLGASITFENGAIEQTNFHQYPLLRMKQATLEIDVHFHQAGFPPTGVGEPALPPLAPAIANAIYAATGERVRTMPLTEDGYSI